MKSSLLSFFFFVICHGQGFSTNYYISSNNGDDRYSGLNLQEAFKTLQFPMSFLVPGDSLFIENGEYTGFYLATSGIESKPIVIKALGDSVIINQPSALGDDETLNGIVLQNADWVHIIGLHVIEQPKRGIRVVTSNHVTLKNNRTYNNGSDGIFTGFTDDIIIEGNTSFNNRIGINFTNSGDRAIIKNNICYHNRSSGIQFNADRFIGGDGVISDSKIYNNIISENGNTGGAINLDGAENTEIFNNLLYNNHATGIAIDNISGARASTNAKVYNNTIVNAADSRWAVLICNASIGASLFNNIIINEHPIRGSIGIDLVSITGLKSNNNILTNRFSLECDGNENTIPFAEWQEITNNDTNSFPAGSPGSIFRDWTNNDYRLNDLSNAVNNGSSEVADLVLTDLDGLMRPQGIGFDIGCYEIRDTTNFVEDTTTSIESILKVPLDIKAFASKGSIQFLNLPKRHTLFLFDIQGRQIKSVHNIQNSNLILSTPDLATGVYFFSLIGSNYNQTGKIFYKS